MDFPLINIIIEIKNKSSNIKTFFILLVSVSLTLPISAQAASIHYSATGTSTDLQTSEIRSLTGHMVISDEPRVYSLTSHPNTDSSITYDVETFMLSIEGIGSVSGSGFLRLEYDILSFFNLQNIGFEALRSVQFFDSGGLPYTNNFAEFADYTELAHLITSSGATGQFGNYDYIGMFNLTLNADSVVPVPAAVWLFGSGLISLIGLARRKG